MGARMSASADPAPPAGPLADAAGAEIVRQMQAPLSAGLYIVATPIGNLGDITLRALAVLQRADVIYCEDTRRTLTLLSHYAISRPLRPYHEHNAAEERPRVLAELAAGRRIALVSDAGTPLVSDPGYKLVREAADRGFPVVALPGPSSLLAGLVVSGLATDTVLFGGFLPVKETHRRQRLATLLAVPATVVVFEAPGRLQRSLAALAELAGEREVVVARELTKRFEEVRRGTARTLGLWAAGEDVRGEIVVMIGPPPPPSAASDEELRQALIGALASLSLKDAAREIAERYGVSRSRVYELGLALRTGMAG